ncbi:ATP-binding protein [Candidatus Woesearchaeota archaeon]|nr:ATP-binding protein [Candidatus Woesearchaeota archaeon]
MVFIPFGIEEMFVGRDNILDILDSSVGSNVFLTGEKGFGKSLLLKEVIRRKPKNRVFIYIDFERISLSPENFAIEYVSKISEAVLGKRDFEEITAKEAGKAYENIEKIRNELEKIKPNQRLLFELAVNFAEVLAGEKGKKIVVCLDEFWKIRALDNYSQIKDAVSLFKSIISSQHNTSYYAAGSAQTLSKQIAGRLGWKIIEVNEFDRRDIKELISVKKLKADADKVYRLSYGIPLVADVILDFGADNFNRKMLCRKGVVYNYLSSLLQEKLGRARGKSQLWVILKKLSFKDMKLAEISSKIYRSSPVTKNLLNRLIEVDLVIQEGSVYSFSNKLLREFVRQIAQGNEYDNFEEVKV